MKQTGKTADAGRVLNAVAMATFWLAGTATGFAAEPTASDNARAVPGASRTKSDLPSIYPYRAADIASLRQGFAAPPREAGSWVFWIFFENVISKAEITRELEEMAAAGIAGAELRFLSMHGFSGKPGPGFDRPPTVSGARWVRLAPETGKTRGTVIAVSPIPSPESADGWSRLPCPAESANTRHR